MIFKDFFRNLITNNDQVKGVEFKGDHNDISHPVTIGKLKNSTVNLTFNLPEALSNEQKSKIEHVVAGNQNTLLEVIGDEEIAIEKIETLEHAKDVDDFFKTGIFGSHEHILFMAELFKSVIQEQNYRDRKDTMQAFELLKELNFNEKRLLVWAFLVSVMSVQSNLTTFRKTMNDVNEVFPFISEFNAQDMYIFAKYGVKPDGNIENVIFTSKFDAIFTKERLEKNGIESKEKFFKLFPEFKALQIEVEGAVYQITKLAPFISGSARIAAMTLLKVECKVNFNN